MPRDSGVSQNLFEDFVTETHQGVRLDVYLADVIEDASRSFIKKVIKEGRVIVNGGVCIRPGRGMSVGDKVAADIPPPPSMELVAEDIPLEILHEDEDLVVVNKPTGLVVHPAPGNYRGTLVNALLHHCPGLSRAAGGDTLRPGIVHRLDQYTSGVLVVAKTADAFAGLSEQVRRRDFDRRYVALVRGELKEDRGRISAGIGRSLSDPGRMSVTGFRAREAVTLFEVRERFTVASLIQLTLETGRTHQIRVHLRFVGHPVLGDPVYGITNYVQWKVPDSLKAALDDLEGQALHAESLGFVHPRTKAEMTFTAPAPKDFLRVLEELRNSGIK